MKMVEMNWKPSDTQLRQFAWISLVGLPLIGWLLMGRPWPSVWSPGQTRVLGSLLLAGVAMSGISMVWPQAIKPVFVAMSLIALPIGMVVSELIFVFLYFGLFTPVALWFRVIGRDALQRKLDRNAATYWQPKAQPANVNRYFRQS